MKLISHRGNIDSLKPDLENSPKYIDAAINLGYDVEIDIRLINDELFLGHDAPDYKITLKWLLDRKNNLWIHTKNFTALSYLIDYDIKTFYHKKEDHVIINNCNLIWSHNLYEANEKSIIPLLNISEMNNINYNVYGICSDFVLNIRELNV